MNFKQYVKIIKKFNVFIYFIDIFLFYYKRKKYLLIFFTNQCGKKNVVSKFRQFHSQFQTSYYLTKNIDKISSCYSVMNPLTEKTHCATWTIRSQKWKLIT